ncbi:MAG: transporter substrate-binding domain-containing protein, partial [Desulfovibrionales bacterium]|nr:transporter substrate-binding domain-containing protein [Desulfovibrionales bacterium]
MPLFLAWLVLFLTCAPLAASTLTLTPAEKAWLDEHKDSIVMGFEHFFPPVEFADADGGFTGLSADVIQVIEKQLNVTFQKRSALWTDVLAGLKTGEIYLAPALVNSAERSEYTFFTSPYVQIPQVILTKKSLSRSLTLNDMTNMRVAVVRGYASATLVRQHVPQSATVIEVDNIREGLHMLSFGVVDALVENLGVATYFQEQEGISNLRVAGDIGAPQKLCIGISTHYPLLASIISKALVAIPQEDHIKFFDRWIHLHIPLLAPEIVLAIKLAVVFTLIALLLLSGIAWHLRRRLKEKIHDEQQAKIALRDQFDRLILTLSVAKAGFWESFPSENTEEYSPEWYTMLGYEPAQLHGNANSWLEWVHPDDKAEAAAGFQAYLQSKEAENYESRYRMRMKDGSWRWFQATGRAVQRDAYGLPTRILGLNVDIHEIKTAQDKAQKAQAFINALLEQSTHFIGLVDLNGTLRLVNHSALSWAKITEQEVIGQLFFTTPWWPDQA